MSAALQADEPNQSNQKIMNHKNEPFIDAGAKTLFCSACSGSFPRFLHAGGVKNAEGALFCGRSFIRIREVISSTPWGGWVKSDMSLELRQSSFIPFWSEARLRRHIEMLKAFGFNSIQATIPTSALWVGADLQEWRKRQLFMLKTARELGLSTSLFIWGAAVADPSLKGSAGLEAQQVSELDWQKPRDRARLEAWYRKQAEMAPYVDRVITHWVDPGHQQQGGIDTVVEMHNVILGIFREKNPKIRGALSTWFMKCQTGCTYPGYEGPVKLAGHPKLDKETEIVLGLMNYGADGDNLDFAGELKAAELDGIADAGRQAGVWGWYTADNEINPALHVRTDVLQNYFRSLPPQTRTKLAWHSLDDNFPGLNMQNLFVAGKLMQDPSLDAGKLLEEFVRGFVGEANAPAVTAALRAVEQARTRSLLYSAKVEDAVAPPPGQMSRKLPAPWLDDSAKAVDAAIAGMKSVKLAPEFKTAWPVTMEPREYLVELNAHLEAIRQMLAFLKGVREVEKLQAGGAPQEKLEDAIAALPKVVYDPAHTAGLEAAIAKQKLSTLKKRAAGVK